MSASRRRQRQRARRVLVDPRTLSVTTMPTQAQLLKLWDTLEHDPAHVWLRTDFSPTSFERFMQRLGKTDVLLLGLAGDTVAGACWLYRETAHPVTREPLYCSVDLYICPPYRGAVGVALCHEWRRQIVEVFGFPQFFATIRPGNKACQHLVTVIGMTRVGLVPKYLPVDGQLVDAVLYAGVASSEVSGEDPPPRSVNREYLPEVTAEKTL